MKALTIWQPWASLIMIGAKPIEWRGWRAPQYVVGERIGIHAGSRKVEKVEVYQLITDCIREGRQIADRVPVEHPTGMDIAKALELLRQVLDAPNLLPRSALLGTAVMGEPRLARDLGFPVDSDRLEHQNWGWPLTDVTPFDAPIAMRGAQGLWTVKTPSDPIEAFVGAL